MTDQEPLLVDRLTAAGREIVGAVPIVAKELYREKGPVPAIAFLLLSPVFVPVVAAFYYSIPREKRKLLGESDEFNGI